jgi:hypothetical protein
LLESSHKEEGYEFPAEHKLPSKIKRGMCGRSVPKVEKGKIYFIYGR